MCDSSSHPDRETQKITSTNSFAFSAMRLLRTDTDELTLESIYDSDTPYAILSHRWLAAEEEVTYADIVNKNPNLRSKEGWSKLDFCRKQAVNDGYRYVWADTACIDKSSSQELTESINSMYRWYKKSSVCYVYLHDVTNQSDSGDVARPTERPTRLSTAAMSTADDAVNSAEDLQEGNIRFEVGTFPHTVGPQQLPEGVPDMSTAQDDATQSNGRNAMELGSSSATLRQSVFQQFKDSAWFTRAWTLQEMIAPRDVRFFDKGWTLIGDLQDMSLYVAEATNVPLEALMKQRPLESYSIAQKFSWAANRFSTKVEDRAYSLTGLMDVSLPVTYGEGPRAFQRLQQELLRSSSDDSIFAFPHTRMTFDKGLGEDVTTLLAESPDDFRDCGHITIHNTRSGDEFQMLTKEVQFKMNLIGPQSWVFGLGWLQSIYAWMWRASPLRPRNIFAQRRVYHRQVILQCRMERSPWEALVLNLVASNSSEKPRSAFYVRGDGPRVEKLDLYNERRRTYSLETFNVVQDPRHYREEAFPIFIACRSNTTGMSLRLVDDSAPAKIVDANTIALNMGEGNEKLPFFQTDFEVSLNERSVAHLHINTHPSKLRFMHVKFQNAFITLPDWTTSILGVHSYSSTAKWHSWSGGFLVARGYARSNPLGRNAVLFLEVQLAGPIRVCYRVAVRALMTLGLVCLGLLFFILASVCGTLLELLIRRNRFSHGAPESQDEEDLFVSTVIIIALAFALLSAGGSLIFWFSSSESRRTQY